MCQLCCVTSSEFFDIKLQDKDIKKCSAACVTEFIDNADTPLLDA